MIDNAEINRILEILENHENETEAVGLLKEFNAASSRLGKLVMNLDQKLSHDEWKNECDKAKKELDKVIAKIDAL